ncbi:Variant surface glycoprotein [Trypanosoma congolense IL3000]|uniref:Variant surface glycoprotein n=1 Tax=Trypanosoma congolense (strain IL3000) TaxID=1068625 RepID=F9WFT5_TRYCI|nr:Variant surface glycoprotein [Trypanosoma congolense IL3000]
MVMIGIWVIVGVVISLSTPSRGTDHNREAYQALCDVLQAAVAALVSGGPGLGEPLRTALWNTIFGPDVEQNFETLKSGPPAAYETVVAHSDSRAMSCGRPFLDLGWLRRVHQVRWSGHSATHDLLCLCTVGNNSWPFHEASPDTTTLCGEGKRTLKAEKGEGWSAMGTGKKQIKATWDHVVAPCLKEGKGKDLKQALNAFLRKLVNQSMDTHPSRYQIGQGQPDPSDACDGTPSRGVCVEYYASWNVTYSLPWWWDLKKALTPPTPPAPDEPALSTLLSFFFNPSDTLFTQLLSWLHGAASWVF